MSERPSTECVSSRDLEDVVSSWLSVKHSRGTPYRERRVVIQSSPLNAPRLDSRCRAIMITYQVQPRHLAESAKTLVHSATRVELSKHGVVSFNPRTSARYGTLTKAVITAGSWSSRLTMTAYQSRQMLGNKIQPGQMAPQICIWGKSP